jgi:hypothetical protein
MRPYGEILRSMVGKTITSAQAIVGRSKNNILWNVKLDFDSNSVYLGTVYKTGITVAYDSNPSGCKVVSGNTEFDTILSNIISKTVWSVNPLSIQDECVVWHTEIAFTDDSILVVGTNLNSKTLVLALAG